MIYLTTAQPHKYINLASNRVKYKIDRCSILMTKFSFIFSFFSFSKFVFVFSVLINGNFNEKVALKKTNFTEKMVVADFRIFLLPLKLKYRNVYERHQNNFRLQFQCAKYLTETTPAYRITSYCHHTISFYLLLLFNLLTKIHVIVIKINFFHE